MCPLFFVLLFLVCIQFPNKFYLRYSLLTYFFYNSSGFTLLRHSSEFICFHIVAVLSELFSFQIVAVIFPKFFSTLLRYFFQNPYLFAVLPYFFRSSLWSHCYFSQFLCFHIVTLLLVIPLFHITFFSEVLCSHIVTFHNSSVFTLLPYFS
jgi:hypothetical protein